MTPLETTIAALAKSRNRAATPTLIAALAASDPRVFTGAVGALVDRRQKAGHEAVVSLWPRLGPVERAFFEGKQGRMSIVLREALLAADPELFASACEIADLVDEFDLIPTLITLAEQRIPDRSERALALAVELIARLEKMSHASVGDRDRQNTDIMRQGVLECLERSVERFRHHRRIELIEAFVALAGPDNKSLRAILDAPHHPCFASVVEILAHSASPAVLSLLTTLFPTADGPQVVRNVVGKRVDAPFTLALLGRPYNWTDPALKRSLARFRILACLEVAQLAVAEWTVEQETTAVRLASICSIADETKLDVIEHILRAGKLPARLAACEAIRGIAGQRSNELVLRAADDAEPEVQIAAASQLRERHIPGTMAKLMELASNSHEGVRLAAREAMPELTIDGFLTQFDSLDESQRVSTASLTVKLDATAPQRLREELESPVARRRLRAIEAIELMQIAPQVADALVERLSDGDHMVRAAAAEALQTCRSEDVRQALLGLLEDRSAAVQGAARASLAAHATAGSALTMGGRQ